MITGQEDDSTVHKNLGFIELYERDVASITGKQPRIITFFYLLEGNLSVKKYETKSVSLPDEYHRELFTDV